MAAQTVTAAAAVVLAVVLALGLVWTSTQRGIGLSADSAAYVCAARSIAAGNGAAIGDFQRHRRLSHVGAHSYAGGAAELTPMTQWPPLLSIALAAANRAGFEPVPFARVMHTLLLGLLVALTAMALRSAGAGPLAVALGAVLVASSHAHLKTHSYLWSEPLFLNLSTATLLATWRYVERGAQRMLLLAAVLAGLASLTRYAGFGVVAAGAMALFVFRAGGRAVTTFSLIGIAPITLWLLRNRLLLDSATGRDVAVHALTAEQVAGAAEVAIRWFHLDSLPQPWGAIAEASLALVALGSIARGHGTGGSDRRLAAIAGAWLLAQAAVLATYATLFSRSVPMDDRILAPFALPLWIALALSLQTFGRAGGRLRRWTVGAIGFVFVAATAADAVAVARAKAISGWGYQQARWRGSPTLAYLATLPKGSLLFTNRPEVVYLHTGHLPVRLPVRYRRDLPVAHPRRGHPAFEEAIAHVAERSQQERGRIVFFHERKPWHSHPEDFTGLTEIERAADGVVYAVASPGTAARECLPIGLAFFIENEYQNRTGARRRLDLMTQTGPQGDTDSPPHNIRCPCGSLLARWTNDGVELKCRRCKRQVVIPYPGGSGDPPERV